MEFPAKTELTRPFWLAVILGGAAARLWLWWISIGSNDAVTWRQFGKSIAAVGLASTYRNLQLYNHPPLMGLYAMQAWRWSGDNPWTFAHLVKLPGLAGEALILWALWRFAGPQASAAYAPACPGGHPRLGDFTATPIACMSDVRVGGRHRLRPAALLSCRSLFWPPPSTSSSSPWCCCRWCSSGCRTGGRFLRLTAGLAIGAAPYIGPVLAAGPAMYRNMVAYNSNPESRGLLVILKSWEHIPVLANSGTAVKDAYLAAGRYVVLAAVTLVALLSKFRGRRPMAEQAALGAALFLLLAPGFGVQYVIFVIPLLCLVHVPAAVRWGSVSGLFIGLVYWSFRVPGAHLASWHAA